MSELTSLIEQRVDVLPTGLQAHIYRVVEIARQLARQHGIDEERAALASLGHDVARAMPDDELLRRATELGLAIGPVDRHLPILLHGPVGAEILQKEDGLDDTSTYNAISWHSTAHPSLDILGKVIFLADKLDPQKISYYPYLDQIRAMAFEDLDRAVLEFITRETIARMDRGELVHPLTIETRNCLLSASATTELAAS